MPIAIVIVPKGVGDVRLRGIEERIINIVSDGLKVDAGEISIVFSESPLTDEGPKNAFVIIYCLEIPERTKELKDEVALSVAKALREEFQRKNVKAICMFGELSCFAEMQPYGSN
ncbi:MAG: hypothetical protein KAS01_01065 [Candidatus Pacebacteria bacterium]|nr:hypothetical protein [Candidatus Paceibacterota bacterium]